MKRKLQCVVCCRELKFLPRKEMFDLGMAKEHNGLTYYHCSRHTPKEIVEAIEGTPKGFAKGGEPWRPK